MTEEILKLVMYTAISIGIGTFLGNGAVFLFNRIPPTWLCDYGEEPSDELKSRDCQRVKSSPYKGIFVALFTIVSLQLLLNDVKIAIPAIVATFILLEIAISDIKYMIIPDQFVMLLTVTGMGFVPHYIEVGSAIWIQPLGALVGFIIMLILGLFSKLIFRKDGLGFGDIKLCGALGFIAGPIGIILIISAGFCVSAIVNIWKLARRKIKKDDERPVGHYFCGATLIYFLFVMSNENVGIFFQIGL